jgi:hypothetical protein
MPLIRASLAGDSKNRFVGSRATKSLASSGRHIHAAVEHAMFLRSLLVLVFGGVELLALPLPARAEARRAEASVAVLAGYGHEFAQGIAGQGVGFAARAGITLPFAIYLGATLTLYLGSEEQGRSPTLYYENRRQQSTFAIDVGYDFLLWDRILVRPYLTMGLLLDSEYTTLGSYDSSAYELAGFVGPAVAIAFKFDPLFVGLDGRLLIYPGEFLPDLAAGTFVFVGTTL